MTDLPFGDGGRNGRFSNPLTLDKLVLASDVTKGLSLCHILTSEFNFKYKRLPEFSLGLACQARIRPYVQLAARLVDSHGK